MNRSYLFLHPQTSTLRRVMRKQIPQTTNQRRHLALTEWRQLPKSYYDILSIKQDATLSQIKEAFYKKSKEHHPDSTKSPSSNTTEFYEICNAYETLKDSELRRVYDISLNANGPLSKHPGKHLRNWKNHQGFDTPKKWRYAHEENTDSERPDISTVLYFIGVCTLVTYVIYYEKTRRKNVLYVKKTDLPAHHATSQAASHNNMSKSAKSSSPAPDKLTETTTSGTLSDLKTWK